LSGPVNLFLSLLGPLPLILTSQSADISRPRLSPSSYLLHVAYLFPFSYSRHDTVATLLHHFMFSSRSPMIHAYFIILRPSLLAAFFSSFALLSLPRITPRSDSPPSILPRYPYILSLFAGTLCIHVQYTYTSTLIPTRPVFRFLSCIRARCSLPLLNISSQPMCHVCLSGCRFSANRCKFLLSNTLRSSPFTSV